jgi:hypothetical protein
MLAIPASAASFSPGAPGIGDPYYPDYGNGGYDVSHYDLRLKYQPATDELEGTPTLLARTTQDLSRFDLDFLLDVSEVRVNGAKASFSTSGEHELQITPKSPLPKGTSVTVVVRYSGVPSSKQAYGFTSWHRTSRFKGRVGRAGVSLVIAPVSVDDTVQAWAPATAPYRAHWCGGSPVGRPKRRTAVKASRGRVVRPAGCGSARRR